MKKTIALFFDFCFHFPEFQVKRVESDGTNYYVCIFNTISSAKPFFFFERPLCLYFIAKTPK